MLYKYKCTYIFLQILDLVPLLSLKIVNTLLIMTVVPIVLLQFLYQENLQGLNRTNDWSLRGDIARTLLCLYFLKSTFFIQMHSTKQKHDTP